MAKQGLFGSQGSVDEEGTTAAAATVIKIVPLSARLDQPKKFVADHPFIFVDEEGTTAAAATFFKIIPYSARVDQPVEFVANHPFIFALTKNNNPLFIGQFV
ncbi:hypothetical protein ANCCAN_25868 [Ancylostoma caninum]|uniref:Serpin domain-containing protein n=1 Tax=Ancylostoma caninum TaxID=29170 RepID=A0A368F8D7_ANCCA|nr:hypothetical protein ANCCAN_25868 [Ancylostoma caninum]